MIWLSILSFCLFPTLTLTSPPLKKDDCRRVRPHESIQKAIDDAQAGERIEVHPGTYKEQLVITKPLNLIGHNAILIPPSPIPNFCTGLAQTPENFNTQTGICIHSQDALLGDFITEHRKVTSIGHRVSNVRVSGFEVRGFSGIGIAIVAGENTRVENNTMADNGLYGLLSTASVNTKASRNYISAATIAGLTIAMCMDDEAGAEFADNEIDGYLIALCGQTLGGVMCGNKVRNCCLGAVADPGIRSLQVRGNHISTRNLVCDQFPQTPGAGVVLLGSVEAVVKENVIEGMRAANSSGVGVFLTDAGIVAEGNMVTGNIFRDNDFDIFDNSTGKMNQLEANRCATSAPGNYCD